MFGVGDFKDVYKQLLANPKTEIVAAKSDGHWLRYTVRAVFETDPKYAAAALEEKRMLLSAKQGLISEVIAQAKDAFVNLPTEQYFELILKLIGQNALKREGEICFSRRDFERLPKDFAAKLVAALPEGAALNVSKEDAKIEGGFILKYDGLEQNLSVEEIFEEKRDQMTDAAGKVLFP